MQKTKSVARGSARRPTHPSHAMLAVPLSADAEGAFNQSFLAAGRWLTSQCHCCHRAMVLPRRWAMVLPRRWAMVLPRRRAMVLPRRWAMVLPRWLRVVLRCRCSHWLVGHRSFITTAKRARGLVALYRSGFALNSHSIRSDILWGGPGLLRCRLKESLTEP